MQNNIFLFTGEEKYLLQQELKRWIDGFVQKFGTDAVFLFDNNRFDLGSLRQALYSGGLFVNKKMIVVYGIPSDLDTTNKISSDAVQNFSEEFMSKKAIISPDTILVFVSYKPDKRTKFVKFLEGEVTVKNYEFLKPAGLKNFVIEHTSGLTWDSDVLEYFLAKIGNNLYHIIHECEKVFLHCKIHNIQKVTNKVIDEVSFGFVESNSFAFFDLLFVDKDKCLDIINDAHEQGVNWNLFAGTLYRGLKIWLFILDLNDQGITDPKVIASTLKAHPFVVSKAVKHLQTIRKNISGIKGLYKGLVELDGAIKMGKAPDFYFWLELKKMIIALF